MLGDGQEHRCVTPLKIRATSTVKPKQMTDIYNKYRWEGISMNLKIGIRGPKCEQFSQLHSRICEGESSGKTKYLLVESGNPQVTIRYLMSVHWVTFRTATAAERLWCCLGVNERKDTMGMLYLYKTCLLDMLLWLSRISDWSTFSAQNLALT